MIFSFSTLWIKQFNSQRSHSLFIWEQEWIKGEFQTKVLGLIRTITESRIRCTHLPIHYTNTSIIQQSFEGHCTSRDMSTWTSKFDFESKHKLLERGATEGSMGACPLAFKRGNFQDFGWPFGCIWVLKRLFTRALYLVPWKVKNCPSLALENVNAIPGA